jgi:WD40 repeat protein
LLELKGHADRVWGVSFSPDGTRIATASFDQTARVWDGTSGKALLELKGHAGRVSSVSFSVDGTQIVTSTFDGTQRIWDAQTGQEKKGEPTPLTSHSGPISPDGRWMAHTINDRIELIPLQPDTKELSDRRRLMQPNYRRYREGYDAARAAGDDFAARFYLKLLPARDGRNRKR